MLVGRLTFRLGALGMCRPEVPTSSLLSEPEVTVDDRRNSREAGYLRIVHVALHSFHAGDETWIRERRLREDLLRDS